MIKNLFILHLKNINLLILIMIKKLFMFKFTWIFEKNQLVSKNYNGLSMFLNFVLHGEIIQYVMIQYLFIFFWKIIQVTLI